MALIAAEFIPVSLLTPIARDLAVSEGMAGQTVTAVGVLAVLTSLLLAPLTGNTDRRRILLAFSAMLVASYMLIGMAPTYSIMLIGVRYSASAWAASGRWPPPSPCSSSPRRTSPAP